MEIFARTVLTGGRYVRLSLESCTDSSNTAQERIRDLLPTLLAGTYVCVYERECPCVGRGKCVYVGGVGGEGGSESVCVCVVVLGLNE